MKKYKGYDLPEISLPSRKLVSSDFIAGTWTCLGDYAINANIKSYEGAHADCSSIYTLSRCDSCVLWFEENPTVFLEFLVDNDLIEKEVALQVILDTNVDNPNRRMK